MSIFDASGKLRVSLDASNVPEQSNGLAVYDTSSRIQVAVGASATPKKGGGISFFDTNGELRAGMGLHENGQAGLSFSAGKKDRDIRISAFDDGNLRLMFVADDTLMAALGLTEREDREISSEFMVLDKDGRSGVVLSGGRTSAPAVRLLDRQPKRRASFELGANGHPGLYVFEQDGGESRSTNALDRVAEGDPLYHSISLSAGLILGGLGGAWIATVASAAWGSLLAAFITGVALVALVALLVLARRRRW